MKLLNTLIDALISFLLFLKRAYYRCVLNGQVTLNCNYKSTSSNLFSTGIRIRKNTFLQANDSKYKSKLVYVENITMYPKITWLADKKTIFKLVFTGLPKNCMSFDLIEDIPENGFVVRNIQRNKSDVYSINVGAWAK